MFVGTHSCRLQYFYDMLHILFTLREISVRPDNRQVKLETQFFPALWAGFSHLIILAQAFQINPDYLPRYGTDTKFKERQKLLAASLEFMPEVARYSASQYLDYRDDDTDYEMITWKKKVDLGEDTEVFIYEMDLEEVTQYILAESHNFAATFDQDIGAALEMGRINLVLMNFFAARLVQTDVLWKFNEAKLKGLDRITVNFVQCPSTTVNQSPSTPVLLFISINFTTSNLTM
jgi:hypothetical protein